jgi:hypothetical protein
MDVLRANLPATPSVLLNTVMLDLDRFAGGAPLRDDVTLMLFRGLYPDAMPHVAWNHIAGSQFDDVTRHQVPEW